MMQNGGRCAKQGKITASLGAFRRFFNLISIEEEKQMRKYFVLVGLLLLIAGSALAQEFPKVETSPAFMFIRNNPNLSNEFVIQNPIVGGSPIAITGANDFNCAGGGGTIAYNLTSMLGIASDLGGCKYFGTTISSGNKISGSQFTYLFGPRLTIRNASPFTPFFELNFGGDRLALTCQSSATACVNATNGNTYSRNAFALTVGGGFDIKINKKFSLRPIQAEYLYTRFGNDCALSVCNNNNNQNSFRLKSGFVVGWGGSASSN
jgi:opacity protein-like surface antigen